MTHVQEADTKNWLQKSGSNFQLVLLKSGFIWFWQRLESEMWPHTYLLSVELCSLHCISFSLYATIFKYSLQDK